MNILRIIFSKLVIIRTHTLYNAYAVCSLKVESDGSHSHPSDPRLLRLFINVTTFYYFVIKENLKRILPEVKTVFPTDPRVAMTDTAHSPKKRTWNNVLRCTLSSCSSSYVCEHLHALVWSCTTKPFYSCSTLVVRKHI